MTWSEVIAAADASLCITIVEELLRMAEAERRGESYEAPAWPSSPPGSAGAALRGELQARWRPVLAVAGQLSPEARRQVFALCAASLASVPTKPADPDVRMMEREGMALWLPGRGEFARAEEKAA